MLTSLDLGLGVAHLHYKHSHYTLCGTYRGSVGRFKKTKTFPTCLRCLALWSGK